MKINLIANLNGTLLGLGYSAETSITIGREVGNTIAALAADGLSRHHAKIYAKDGKWYLEDLGSTNGSYRQGQKIEGAVELNKRDMLQFGKLEISVDDLEAGAAEAAPAPATRQDAASPCPAPSPDDPPRRPDVVATAGDRGLSRDAAIPAPATRQDAASPCPAPAAPVAAPATATRQDAASPCPAPSPDNPPSRPDVAATAGDRGLSRDAAIPLTPAAAAQAGAAAAARPTLPVKPGATPAAAIRRPTIPGLGGALKPGVKLPQKPVIGAGVKLPPKPAIGAGVKLPPKPGLAAGLKLPPKPALGAGVKLPPKKPTISPIKPIQGPVADLTPVE